MRAREAASSARACALASACAASSAKSAIRCSAPSGNGVASTLEHDHRAPQAAVEEDGRGDRGAEPDAVQLARDQPADLLVVVDPGRRVRLEHPRGDRVALHAHPRADRHAAHPGLVPGADRERDLAVEAHQRRGLRLEQARELLGDHRERLGRIAPGGDRGRHAPERRLLGGQPAQVALTGPRLGDVADVAGEQRRTGDVRAGDDQLDREDAAVLAHALALERVPLDRRVPGAHDPLDPATVAGAPARRDDQRGQLAADHLLGRVAERLLGGAVDLDHLALVVHRDDAVEGRVEDRRLARVRRLDGLHRAAALGEVRDLQGEAVDRRAHLRVGLVAGREGDDARARERQDEPVAPRRLVTQHELPAHPSVSAIACRSAG